MRSLFARVAGRAVERPTQVVVAAVLLTLIGAIASLRLAPDASVNSLVDTDSSTYAATQEFHQQFGDDPVVVMVRDDLGRLLLTPQRDRLLALEGCLSGKAKGGRVFPNQPAPAPCAKIAALRPSFAVYGPATFLNQFAIRAGQLFTTQQQQAQLAARTAGLKAATRARKQGYNAAGQAQAAKIAGYAVLQQFQQALGALAVKAGQSGLPSLSNPRFVSSVVFDSRLTGNVPKAQFSSLLPSPSTAMIYVRLRPGMSEAERQQAIGLYRAAVDDPHFKLRDGSYVTSGVPVVVEGLANELSSQTFILLAVALAVMAITLALVFRPPMRLLPLALALGATAIAFGILSIAGGSLTMAAIAVLPVLIGLAVDYAIQLQARFDERVEAGSRPVRAAVEAASGGGPVIATAALATAAGFVVLLLPFLSPIPLIHGFAVLLVIGVVVAFALAVTAGLAVLSLTRPGRSAGPRTSRLARAAPANPRPHITAIGRRVIATSIAAPGRILLVAAALAVAGWIASTQISLVSDFRELLPKDLPALAGVTQIQRATGASGEVDVTVTADDLTNPRVVEWMKSFEHRVLTQHGFSGQYPSCRSPRAEICPAIALPDLFQSQSRPTRAEVHDVLNLLPPYFAGAFIAHQPRPGQPDTTVIQFRVKALPFDRQEQLYDDIRSQLGPGAGGPPAGVSAKLVGLPVLFADANSAQSSRRPWAALAALMAVALVLLAVYRSARRALVPLIPIVFATGWSSLVLYATGVPLNPLSATLGALVIAIATEFSVILSARFHEEREGGGSLGEALRRAYSRTGAAVLASGITAIAGFAVLIVSDITMLSDFGLVTVLDLAVALAGVLAVLPAALVWAEGGFQVSLCPEPRADTAPAAPGSRGGSFRPPLMADGGEDRKRPARSAGVRYVAFVGVAFLILIAVATYNTVSDATSGLLGVTATIRGRPLPEFAVPNVRGGPDADANIYQDDCASSDNPCPADQRRHPACRVPASFHAIRVCDYFNRPLVISFWFLEGASCLPTQDIVNRVAQRFRGRVNFLSIDVRDDRSEVDRTVAEHKWRIPVGWDRDGAVSDLYRVGGCPTVALAYPGGIFAGAHAGEAALTRSKLTADVRELIAASNRRAAASR